MINEKKLIMKHKRTSVIYLSLLLFASTTSAETLFFSCKLPPLKVEIYTDKEQFSKPHTLVAYTLKDYDEVIIEDPKWKQEGTGMCGTISWEFQFKGVEHSVETMGCFGNNFPPPENANGKITINNSWYWCYK